MAAALLLLGFRNGICLSRGLPAGAWGDPRVLLDNKLEGWLHIGTVSGQWSWEAALAGVLWEWLPATLFGWGLFLRAQSSRPIRVPSLPRQAYPWLPAGLLFLIATAISLGVFEGIPHIQDSIAQQFQAQIFARGRAWAPVPEEGWVLRSEYMVQQAGRWYAQYPPGHAAVLALGVVLGVPWLSMPVLAALSAVLLHSTARQLYGPRTARLALWLFCLSPFVWFMSGERMNHVTTLFWVCAALCCLAPALKASAPDPRPARLLLGGLALGFAMCTRPLCGVAVAFPLIVAALTRPTGDRGRKAIALAAGSLMGGAPLLLFNAATTGSPWVTGYQAQWGNSGWGFGQAQWGSPHTLAAGLAHFAANWDGAARYLFEWPLPSLLPLLCCLLLPRRKRADGVLLAMLASLSLAYLPYFFQDLCLGPRFLYAGVPALILLSARGLMAAGIAFSRRRGESAALGLGRLREALFLLTVAGLLVNLPLLLHWYGRDFWGASTRLVREAERRKVGRAVVFIRDYGRLRCEELRRRGVTLAAAQAAVDRLDPGWLDARLTEWDKSTRSDRTERLTEALLKAVRGSVRRHQRTEPPWIDPNGISSNISLGLWANSPWPHEQDVIYALHPGAHLPRVVAAFPDRSYWEYGWIPERQRFDLRQLVMPIRNRAEPGSPERRSR